MKNNAEKKPPKVPVTSIRSGSKIWGSNLATAELRFQPEGFGGRRNKKPRMAAMRLMDAERSDEIFSLLLEEIAALGYPRALVLEADFHSGRIVPAAAHKWPRLQAEKLATTLSADSHPITRVLLTSRPAVLTKTTFHPRPVYLHPILYSQNNVCWEAGRVSTAGCLAVRNSRREAAISTKDQTCLNCEIRGYAAVAVVELAKRNTEADLAELGELVELANMCLSRLHRAQYRYERVREMEITIAQMATVMQSMTDPVMLTDTQHHVIMQSKAAERFFKAPANARERDLRALDDNRQLFASALSTMLVSGIEPHRDLVLLDVQKGAEVIFEAVAAPTYGPDGVHVGAVTVMRDVTELRLAGLELRSNFDKLRSTEEIVRQDRDRLNLIIENVGDPIVVCDRQAHIILMDTLAQELFGNPAAVGASRSAPQSKNQEIFAAYSKMFTSSASDRETAPLQLYSPAVRQSIEYDARSGKIFDEMGHVAFTVTVLRDLTALRKVEQLKVERRILEIEKFAATGRLAATIAHEVNNPMEAIKNSIYLLAESIPPDALPIYNILKSETERVARIVRQMLGLYRNNEQVKPVNVNTIIEDTLLLLNRQLQRANVEVRLDLRELPDAVIAADQIRQVLSNIIINARDSMPDGGKMLIRTRHLPGRNELRSWVRILVADNGTGIPRDLQRAIFEPFVTTKGEKGTGLGLWIVKGIIQNHAGKLSVRSTVGKGTVFKIDLPVVRL